MESEHFHALPKGYQFEDYELVRVLGHGGFGITYLGYDNNLDKPVAIKEYLPDGLAVRDSTNSVVPKATSLAEDFQWGLDRFLDEAKTLARFRHLNLIQVLRFFRANGTGYIVMEYAEGETLADLLNRKDKLTHDEIWSILEPLLSGLEELHARQFMHRDIKPANIIIRDDGLPVLIDFGAARQAVGSKSQSLTAIVTPRFAPLEQYSPDGNQGPWTDIYAMGAVAYRALTGELPPDPTQRVGDDPYVPARELAADRAPEGFLRAVDWALALMAEERPQSVAEWRKALESGAVEEKPPPKKTEPLQEAPETSLTKRTSKSSLFWWLGVLLLLVVGFGGKYFWAPPTSFDPEEDPFADLIPVQTSASLIEEAQEILNRLGYEVGEPDGVMGPRTDAVVRQFEKDQGLVEAGVIDTLLINKLRAELNRRDEAAWQAAIKAGSTAAFEKYRRVWPDGRHVGDIDATRDRLTWEKAKAANTIPAYETYRAAWPQGARVREAEIEIAKIKAALKKAERLKAEQEKKARLKAAQEEEAWSIAQMLDTADEYKSYIKAYPTGKYLPAAQTKIAKMYRSGEGVTRSDVEALKWFRLAADQGFAEAQYFIGNIYDHGMGVTQNKAEAAKWYRLAADKRFTLAQFVIGSMYENGKGVRQDLVEALKWYIVGRALGHQGAASREKRLRSKLWRAQIARAERQAEEWLKTH